MQTPVFKVLEKHNSAKTFKNPKNEIKIPGPVDAVCMRKKKTNISAKNEIKMRVPVDAVCMKKQKIS